MSDYQSMTIEATGPELVTMVEGDYPGDDVIEAWEVQEELNETLALVRRLYYDLGPRELWDRLLLRTCVPE